MAEEIKTFFKFPIDVNSQILEVIFQARGSKVILFA